ncbi:hypothetical protein [Alteromonas antoniana]|uniref:hypothetical protein n=1 Tax=Alteromonas antoniana TaxID=2803813 RepID=UPI001C45F0CB|nr:hypothetical protein [Alteromonas antoniana]
MKENTPMSEEEIQETLDKTAKQPCVFEMMRNKPSGDVEVDDIDDDSYPGPSM